MSVFKRTFTYLKRNIGRCAILFAVMTALITTELVCTAIISGVEKEAEKFRHQLQTGFTVAMDVVAAEAVGGYEDTNGDGIAAEYTGPRLSKELVRRIADIEGVEKYTAERVLAAVDTGLALKDGMWAYFASGDYIEAAVAGGADEEDIEDLREIQHATIRDNMMSQPCFTGVLDSSLNEFFALGAFEIVRGRHITPEDEHVVVLSEYVAEKNGLSLGDEVTAIANEASFEAYTPLGDGVTAEIIGIYKVNFSFEPSEYTAETEIPENFFYVDFTTWSDLRCDILDHRGEPYDKEGYSYDTATFYVSDPLLLNSVIDDVYAMDDLNWDWYYIEKDDTSYAAAVKPLDTISGIMGLFMAVTAISCFLVVFLLLRMWSKSRGREAQVFFSLGISKRSAVLQRVTEAAVIAVFAAAAAVVIAFLLAVPVGEAVETGVLSGNTAEEKYHYDYNAGTREKNIEMNAPADISVEYGADAGLAVIIAFSCAAGTAGLAAAASRGIYKREREYF